MLDELVKSAASGAGFAGLLLLYHLMVTQKDMRSMIVAFRKIEEAIDRSTHSDLLRLIASPHVATDLKDAATELLKATESAQKARELTEPATKA